jgi:proteic killer suppression protein
MMKSFGHKGLQRFFETGSKSGIQSGHAEKRSRQLVVLNRASGPLDMNLPGWSPHPLKGNLAEYWSVSVSGNRRLTFTFDNGDAILIDYQDQH